MFTIMFTLMFTHVYKHAYIHVYTHVIVCTHVRYSSHLNIHYSNNSKLCIYLEGIRIRININKANALICYYHSIQCDPFLPIPLYWQLNQSPGQVTVSSTDQLYICA
jgi:hypothetical protein